MIIEMPNGYDLIIEKNQVGGYTYTSSEVGQIVWDTALVDIETLEFAIAYEKVRRKYEIRRQPCNNQQNA